MQNTVPSNRITSLYGFQLSSVVYGCKSATFGPELQVSMGLRTHLSFCACKTARLVPELLGSMGPCPHLWLLHAKQGLVDQNYKSLWVPTLICGFSKQNSVMCIRMTSLYGFQLSSAVLCMQNSDFGPAIQVCMGPRPHLWFWALITSCLAQEYQDHMSSSPHLWFCACKTETLGLELQVSVRPRLHLCFLHAKQRLLDQNNKSLWVPDMTCRFVHVQQRA